MVVVEPHCYIDLQIRIVTDPELPRRVDNSCPLSCQDNDYRFRVTMDSIGVEPRER